jgi:DnaJ family protein C protein 11
LREEYEKHEREKRELDLENLVRDKSEIQLTLNATQVFDNYEPPVYAGFGQTPIQPRMRGPLQALSKTQVQQLFMRHSFQVRTEF